MKVGSHSTSYALLWGGSALISFSLFMLSLTEKDHFYQVLLSQGFGVGIGVGMIYVPSVAILSHYFRQRRSLVMTIVAAGSSLGAVVHPIMLNNLIPKIGFAKATRANAGLISGLLLIACLIMKTRLPPPTTTPNLKKSLVKFSKDKAYICCIFGYVQQLMTHDICIYNWPTGSSFSSSAFFIRFSICNWIPSRTI